MKSFIDKKIKISFEDYMDFVLYLESCKGFEEDAKRFLFSCSQTDYMQLSYKTLRPIFMRTLAMKSKAEVLKLFEQSRKNLVVNTSIQVVVDEGKEAPSEDQRLEKLRVDFYDGILTDLVELKKYDLAQIIYFEKANEGLEVTFEDELRGLKIFANRGNLDEFKSIFEPLLESEGQLTEQVAERAADALLEITGDAETVKDRTRMLEALYDKCYFAELRVSSNLFSGLIYTALDRQDWASLKKLIG